MIHRALSGMCTAFIETVIHGAEVQGLIPGDDWMEQASAKDSWRQLLTELFERHGEDLS